MFILVNLTNHKILAILLKFYKQHCKQLLKRHFTVRNFIIDFKKEVNTKKKGTSQTKICSKCYKMFNTNNSIIFPKTSFKIEFSLQTICDMCIQSDNSNDVLDPELDFFDELEDKLEIGMSQNKNLSTTTLDNSHFSDFEFVNNNLHKLLTFD